MKKPKNIVQKQATITPNENVGFHFLVFLNSDFWRNEKTKKKIIKHFLAIFVAKYSKRAAF